MKDIKVIFKSNKVPSGCNSNTEYYIGAKKLENLQKDGRFDIEVLERPKPKAAPKLKKKKATKKEESE